MKPMTAFSAITTASICLVMLMLDRFEEFFLLLPCRLDGADIAYSQPSATQWTIVAKSTARRD